MINYHNIVFPFLHRHGCRQEADSNFRDFARTSQIKSIIRQSRLKICLSEMKRLF
ncbi:uncharacterized protein BN728_02353 [Phocaeicola vulgatus CAG:6]|nr:uncharacterized protein BN728_02353 [Phocaeicola vulgatus CAG:6]